MMGVFSVFSVECLSLAERQRKVMNDDRILRPSVTVPSTRGTFHKLNC
jgi:hypothetical protein